MLKDHKDAQGHAFLDHLLGKAISEIVERDDGYIEVSGSPAIYFREFGEWGPHEKEAMKYVRGKVLDIGCGAGRHALYLQERGFEVLGIDLSPLAIEVCRKRGLKKAKVLSVTQISAKLGKFDTVLMLGNNFGLVENPRRARWFLKRFRAITTERGRIIAETLDPYRTDNPDHLSYHEFNRKRGRMPGQVRIRIRYRKYKTPWFGYLFVSKEELKDILKDTGWFVVKYLDRPGGNYMAIMDRI